MTTLGTQPAVHDVVTTKGQPKRSWTLPSKNEIVRKIIHMGSFAIPILSGLVGLLSVTLLILSITLLYVLSELARTRGKDLPIISSITRYAARGTELKGFAAAPVFFAFGILATLLLFPHSTSSAAITIFALGDSTASIFGRIAGKTPLFFNRKKTLEGSLFGFASAFLAATFYITPLRALSGAAVAMMIESLPLPLNDNISVPLFTGVALTFII